MKIISWNVNGISAVHKKNFLEWFKKFRYGFNARERNLGWRIDYIFLSRILTPKLKKSFISAKIKDSDHCPIGIELT